MGQTLTNGIYLPNEGERNCYSGLAANWNAVDTLKGNYSLHAINVDIHVTAAEKETWNGKADASALTAHTGDTTIHVTSADKQTWNGHVADSVKHVTAADKQAWNGKADASALTAHTGNTTIHVTAEDKEAWNGKADASALTAHTGDTTIHVTAEDKAAWDGHVADSVKHVTAEDKAKWDAVTSKADDSDVVHKSGDETVGGVKTFSDNTYITSLNFTSEVASQSSRDSAILPIVTTVTYTDQTASQSARLNLRITASGDKSLYPHENNQYSLGLTSRRWSDFFSYHGNFAGQQQGDEYSGNARTNLTLLANRDTAGQSGCVVDTFRENTAQGTGSHILGFGIKENSVRYEGCRFLWYWDNNLNGYSFSFIPTLQGANQAVGHNLGTSTKKWDTINGLNPSSLGMPSDRSARIDISSYFTNTGTGQSNSYTVPANGYIYLTLSELTNVHCFSRSSGNVTNYAQTFTKLSNSTDALYVLFPVRKNDVFVATWYTTTTVSVDGAFFIPCQGNI